MEVTLTFNIPSSAAREMAKSLKLAGQYILSTKGLRSEVKRSKLYGATDYAAQLLREIAEELD